jgi:hypothetical protein
VVLIAAVCVIALVLTLQRFYRNLLKSEGYLMFTLPVSTDALIWSKLFVAAIWTILSFIVVVIAVSIMAMTGDYFKQMFMAMRDFFLNLQGQSILYVIEALILGITALFSAILLLYVCMALSLLVNKHRVGFAFLMYIAISILGQIVFAVVASAVNATRLWRFFEDISTWVRYRPCSRSLSVRGCPRRHLLLRDAVYAEKQAQPGIGTVTSWSTGTGKARSRRPSRPI